MFGFKKKRKIVKPTTAQKKVINVELRKQYPQMFTKSWVSMLKGKVKKEFKTARTLQIESQLHKAGISDKRILQLRGKK